MKKLLLFIICVSAFPLVAEELTFVTTMGAKIGSFNRLDTVNPNKTNDLKKLNFGGANISGGSINLKGNASTIGTLNINANTVSSPTVAVYQLASMTVRPDTTLKGKGLLAGEVTSSAKRMELTVKEVLYNTATATVQGAKTPNLKITGKAYITGGGMGADMVWSNRYQPNPSEDAKVYLLKGRSSSTCISSATYTETPVVGGKNSSGGWEVPKGIPYNTCDSGGKYEKNPNFITSRHVCNGTEDYACVDSYYQESATEKTTDFTSGYGSAVLLYAYAGSFYPNSFPENCGGSGSSWTPKDLSVFEDSSTTLYLHGGHATIGARYNDGTPIKDWIDLCGDSRVTFDRDGYYDEYTGPKTYLRHEVSTANLQAICSEQKYRDAGIYGLYLKKVYTTSEHSYKRLYIAFIGYCFVEPAREYYTGTVQCCAN